MDYYPGGMPYGSRGYPGADPYYDVHSPSPTPSPHHYPYSAYPPTPRRPAHRAAHVRRSSATAGIAPDFRPSTAFSPRQRSTGEYVVGTGAAPSPNPKVSSRKHSFSKGSVPQHHHPRYYDDTPPKPRKHERRRSHTYHRVSPGDSDEDEIIELDDGTTLRIPAASGSPRRGDDGYADYYYYAAPRRQTYSFAQTRYDREQAPFIDPYESPRPPTRAGHKHHSRRPSMSTHPIQRPQTARPTSSRQQKPSQSAPQLATDADARQHKIPYGFSLKNWDPNEYPITLLGSVFDCNSLGKWIYDWTVYHHGRATPMAELAGDLWLLLIQLAGHMKRLEEVSPSVRSAKKRKLVKRFLTHGKELLDVLQGLMEECEGPMLQASKKKEVVQLGENSGVEFVVTLFGRDRELHETEKLMQKIRTWTFGFDRDCEDVIQRPTE
ncbi:vegetative cell wall protein gp1 [Xylariomycetidae sp. FL0641]|nr:vegetative cell wall protein gp1 [Xylariomycetidae sp. FL0641]